MKPFYNGRPVTIIKIEKGEALVMSTHNPRPNWVKLKFITYIGGQAIGN